ncbi:DUF2637 domain-containing protein [Streptomyces violaceusniger]|nr:DUF2637 domain-containing protein [Streptomyces violaceusniger]
MHRILIGVVVTGAVGIAGIGFAGSYSAVRDLARDKGFGQFSNVFPIGIDAGIVVLLALDLLLTWIRIPFPLLRQTAWLLTAATIAFNGAAAWPDPIGVGMHAVIPILFVVSVEAARHAVGRIADITADRHMESVRITRWLLAPVPTFRLWRRMKLWELRSYDEVIRLEQDRLVYQARLRARYGRSWRRKAPVESLMPLRLARYGVPLSDTAPAGLAAAGLEPFTVSVDRADDQPLVTQPDTEHQRALDTREITTTATGPEELGPAPDPVNGSLPATAGQTPTPSVIDFYEAVHAYVAQYGSFPNAHQFGFFLHDAYNVTDPATGGPVAEEQLRPVLQELRQAAREPAERQLVADESAVTDRRADSGSGTAEGPADMHAFFGTPSVEPAAPQPYAAEPVPAMTAPVAEAAVPEQMPMDATPTVTAGQPSASTGSGAGWDTTVADAGIATVRVPEQQSPESDAEEQQNRMIAGWLTEAEAAGKKLSGAEVARRLDVSPRTGQRALNKAKEYRTAQQRQQGRGHLRSVSGRS